MNLIKQLFCKHIHTRWITEHITDGEHRYMICERCKKKLEEYNFNYQEDE